VGVLSETGLAFTGLNRLYATLLDHLGRIPVPQRDALRTAFGVAVGRRWLRRNAELLPGLADQAARRRA
jgi:hypothetical protein